MRFDHLLALEHAAGHELSSGIDSEELPLERATSPRLPYPVAAKGDHVGVEGWP